MNRKPIVLVSAQPSELPAGDLLIGSGLVRESVGSAETMTIPSGYQYVVHGSFDLSGTADVQGTLVLL